MDRPLAAFDHATPAIRWPTAPLDFAPLESLDATAAPPVDESESLIEQLVRRWRGVHRRTCPHPDVQLEQSLRRPVDVVVINALDLDVDHPVQASWAARHGAKLVRAAELLAGATSAGRVQIVIDSAAPTAWFRDLRRLARRKQRQRSLESVNNRFPLAEPTLLLHTLLRRRLRPGRSPVEVGVLVLDAIAAVELVNLVEGNAATPQPLSIVDTVGTTRRLLSAPSSATIAEVLAAMEIDAATLDLRHGSRTEDRACAPAATIGSIEPTLHLLPQGDPVGSQACVRCGWCVDICPTRVHSAGLLDAAQRDDADAAERFGVHACIDCGLCTAICPSRLPIHHAIRTLRGEVT